MDNNKFHSAQHLTYEELIEYSQGNLSNSEMHRLELHLISCELCNDALDGIAMLRDKNQAGKSIEKIKLATLGKETKELNLYQYIGIAASIVLIAVLGFVFLGGDNDEANTLAEQAPIEKNIPDTKPQPSSEEIDKTDDSAAIDTTLIAEEIPEERPTTPAQQTTTPTKPIPADSGAPQVAKVTIPPIDSTIIADADITLDVADAGAINDSAVLAESMALRQAETESRAKKAAEPMAAQEDAAELNEVVVTQDFTPAEPEKGMRTFERYIKKNKNYPDAAKESSITGDVVLRISVTADGSIGRIEVAKSLGYGCDEEAIRLIREGGTWIPASRGGSAVADTISITVSFEP